jgi:hypothetical protein
MKVWYKGTQYFVISSFGNIIEIAPTQYGAGSFIVHRDFVNL